MKRLLSIILTVIMIVSSVMCVSVYAADEIKVTINGKEKTFDVMPVIINNRTLVPMRGIFEELGASITWDEYTQSVTAVAGSTTIILQVGKITSLVNGKYVSLDAPAQLINDRTMVPVRFVSETLGCKVEWADSTRTVVISGDVTAVPSTPNTPSAPSTQGGSASDAGWTTLAQVNFEDQKPTPSSAINFWGKLADDKNSNFAQSYAKWSDISGKISKPNSTEDFGSVLIKLDSSACEAGPSVKGVVEGRINDIPADNVPYKAGEQYRLSMWFYLAETALGGNSAKIALRPYSGKTYVKDASKTFTINKGEWTKLELVYTATADDVGQTTGVRFGFAAVADGDFLTVAYMDNVTFSKASDGSGSVAVTPAPSTPSTGSADAKLPAGGTVIATQEDLLTAADGKKMINENGVFKVVVATKPEKDSSPTATSKNSLAGKIKKDNVYMLTFKARLVSGSPYIKAFIQADKEGGYSKVVFALTSYGSDWTTCYMPFKGSDKDMNGGWGFRLGGAAHTSEIKDLQIIDYGTSVKIEDLPHTYITDGAAASVNGLKIQ